MKWRRLNAPVRSSWLASSWMRAIDSVSWRLRCDSSARSVLNCIPINASRRTARKKNNHINATLTLVSSG